MDKAQAQGRADRVRAFQAELAELGAEGVLALTDEQRTALDGHHAGLLQRLAGEFDVDVTGEQKQLSLGMRVVAFLGAVAASASVYFLFYRVWGYLGTATRVLVLLAAPAAALAAVELSARRERTGYFAGIAAMIAFACFVLDLALLGDVFSVTPSHGAFLAWAAFAFLLAYGYRLRLLQIAGIACLMGYLAATVGTWSGCYWLSTGERPEAIALAGLAVFGVSFLPHRAHPTFPGTYRLFGLLAVLIAILVLANWGTPTFLPLLPEHVEHVYQVAGFLVSGGIVWLGVRARWPGVTNLGTTFFALFLYTKVYDWWWEWMPRWLFFLVVALVAVLLLLVLRRLRAATLEVRP